MRKNIMRIVAATTIVAVVATGVTVYAVSNKKVTVAKKALNKKGKYLVKKTKDSEYKLVNVNADKIPEMFYLYPSGVRGALRVYQYDAANKKVVRLKTFNGFTRAYKNKKKNQIIICQSGGARENYITTYKVGKGKLTKVLCYKTKVSTKGKTETINFYKNGKKIAEEVYEKYAKTLNYPVIF